MEVTQEQLLDIFKAGFRVAESKLKKGGQDVATNCEIEADAVPIVANILKREFYAEYPRKAGKTARLDSYKGVF